MTDIDTEATTVNVLDLFRDNPDYLIEANEAFSEACHAACDRQGKATIAFVFNLTPSFAGKMPRIDIEPDLSEMTHFQLRDELERVRRGGLAEGPVVFHLHRQMASSFACFGFMLVGVPLGIRAHRRETSLGLAMALGVAMVYYLLHALAQSLETRPEYYPHLLNWLPNFLFVALGGWLFFRANRGAGF